MILREYSGCQGFHCCTVSSMQERKGDSFLIFVSLTQLQQKSLVFVEKTNSNTALRIFRHFFSASIREGRVALSVGYPRGTHSRYVIGCCPIPLGICGLKNNSRRITYGIGCVRRMPSLSPLSSLAPNDNFFLVSFFKSRDLAHRILRNFSPYQLVRKLVKISNNNNNNNRFKLYKVKKKKLTG